MTRYEHITLKRVTKLFFWTLFLSPLILFLLVFCISSFVYGFAETIAEVNAFLPTLNLLEAIGYFTLLATAFTAIVISATLHSNYKWKKFFTSVAVNQLNKKHNLILNDEGLEGYYKNVKVAIKYYNWKDIETATIAIFKKNSLTDGDSVANGFYSKHKNTINLKYDTYEDAVARVIDIKGKRKKLQLNLESLLDEFIAVADADGIIIERNTVANPAQALNSAAPRP